ncbi:MAG: phage major capsid protein, partial [Geminicoccaceae bacterium]|nr:phage major capsid protein [Geminicoccaceae bacterium]
FPTGVYPIVFMTRDCYQIIDRVGMDMQRYDDSTTAMANQVILVARRRVGGQPIVPWGVAALRIT